jgi:catechol 1,2-dioxygenase
MNAQEQARLQVIFDDLQSMISDLVFKHEITEQEFEQAIGMIDRLVRSGELPVASGTFFGFSVKAANDGRAYRQPEKDGATTWLPLGPAYVPGAPVQDSPCVLPMRPDEPGEILIVSGQVRSTDGTPIAGAVLDIWMTNTAGDYSGLTPEMLAPLVLELDDSLPEYNLRGKIRTDDDGCYEYRTVMPGIESLGIPEDGPLGGLYRALERVDERPLHIHSIVTADGFHTLTTQSHFAGDPHVGKTSEPLSTPDSTVFDTELHDDPQDIRARNLDAPYYSMPINYVMRPAS